MERQNPREREAVSGNLYKMRVRFWQYKQKVKIK